MSTITPPDARATTRSATRASLGTLKQIDAGLLNVGYAEAGPSDGPAAVLLHGWPYDIHSFVEVTPRLVRAGYRVIVPYLRGYGTTTFLSTDTFRNGQQSALALDTIALMDALRIETAVLAGFDWGARSADIIAALWPDRCRALVSVSGYLIGTQEANRLPLPPQAELQWWYQYYFATERGRLGYGQYTREFNKLIWQLASPKWQFDEATFDQTAASFDNPDHVDIVIHNYRWRLGLKANPNMTASNGSSPVPLPSPCPPSRWKVMPMAHHTRTSPRTPTDSRASTSTGSSRAASDTTFLRKPRRLSPEQSSTSTFGQHSNER